VTREGFQSTSTRGLDRESLPMRLYAKAKRLGTWDPAAIDFTEDVEHWHLFDDDQREAILQLTSLFQAGEEGVTLDLLPLIEVVATEGRLEEELFLTTFLWEEGKHVDFFRRFLDEVCGTHDDLHRFHTPSYKLLFYDELPRAMSRLREDASPAAQVNAVVTYNMVIEGMLAETGYHSYFRALEQGNMMPGLRGGIANVKRDESRHIAYGVFLLTRLIAENPELWDAAEARMMELLEPATAFIAETFEGYEDETSPFGLTLEEIAGYSAAQFSKRLDRIRRGAQNRDATAAADEELAEVASSA
jgi:ribonucleoside-diphosphate reductase beta chain